VWAKARVANNTGKVGVWLPQNPKTPKPQNPRLELISQKDLKLCKEFYSKIQRCSSVVGLAFNLHKPQCFP